MTAQPDMFGADVPDLEVGGKRDPYDRYFTPSWATSAFVDHMGKRLHGLIWEPCAGHGYIVDVLRGLNGVEQVFATDILPHDSLDDTANFLDAAPRAQFQSPLTGDWVWSDRHVDWIITNPPYTTELCTATDIVRHALKAFPRSSVAMLLRLSWIEPCEDRADLLLDYRPTDYIVLPRVHYIGAPRNNNQTSIWVVWDRSEKWRWDHAQEGFATVKHYSADECRQWGR